MTTDLDEILTGITLRTSKNSEEDLIDHAGGIIDLAKITPPRLHLFRSCGPLKYPCYQVYRLRPGNPQDRDSAFPNRSRDRSDSVIQRHNTISHRDHGAPSSQPKEWPQKSTKGAKIGLEKT